MNVQGEGGTLLLSKLKPNVLLVALGVALLTFQFGAWLIAQIAGPVSSEILAMLVGIGIGGLVTLAGGLAQDPPPPTVPADLHAMIVQSLAHKCDCGKEDE